MQAEARSRTVLDIRLSLGTLSENRNDARGMHETRRI